jgi:hypothetical protein
MGDRLDQFRFGDAVVLGDGNVLTELVEAVHGDGRADGH